MLSIWLFAIVTERIAGFGNSRSATKPQGEISYSENMTHLRRFPTSPPSFLSVALDGPKNKAEMAFCLNQALLRGGSLLFSTVGLFLYDRQHPG